MTVLSAFREILPNENCVFFGDTKNMPYGEKTKEQLIEYSIRAFKFFEHKNVKAVVMACNTTSAVVYEELKDKFSFKLYPLIQSVSKIFANMPVKKIGIFATPATINSHAYSKWINLYNISVNVMEIACPQWVKIVENNEVNTEYSQNSVKSKMDEMLKYNPDVIVLGCTHYPYLMEQLLKFAPKEIFLNPAKAYAEYIKNDLETLHMLNMSKTKGYDEFYVSGTPKSFVLTGRRFYNIDKAVEVNVNIL